MSIPWTYRTAGATAAFSTARRTGPLSWGVALALLCLAAASLGATTARASGAAAAKPVRANATTTLVPNVSIGAVKLGMKTDAAKIKKLLGKGATSSAAGDEVRLTLKPGLLIVRLYQGTVVEMETTAPAFVAAGKVHVGSPASTVRSALGGGVKTTGDSLYVVGKTSFQSQVVHTYFDLSAGGSTIASIRIGYFPWLNPCYGGPTQVTANLTASQTWGLRGCPYIVSGQVRIPQGATLTVKAGVIVKFKDAGSGLFIDGGQLLAQGTPDTPVVFTSINDQNHGAINTAKGAAPKAGDWVGLQVMSGGTVTLNHVAVYYAGADRFRPAGLFAGNGGNPTVTVQDSFFGYNAGFGIDAGNAPAGTIIKHTAFFGNEKALQISGVMSLDGSNIFAPAGLTPNKQNAIFLSTTIPLGGTSGGKVVWAENRTPFVLQGQVRINANDALELGPGVMVKGADPGAALQVTGGTLTANGTATQPVVFTAMADDKHGGDTNGDRAASQPAPGAWIGLSISGAAGTLTLKHTQVLYGGADRFRPADLTIANGANLNVDVENSTFAYSAGWGLDAGSAPATTKLTGNAFYGDKQALQLGPGIALDSTNVFHGPSATKQNAVFLVPGFAVNQGMAVSLQVTEVPYVIADNLRVNTGGSLTIAAGVTLKAATTAGAVSVNGGTLTVQGSAGAPVVMTSLFDSAHGGDTSGQGAAAKPNAGDWLGLQLVGTTRATLDHLVVLYAGSDRFLPAGIVVRGDTVVSLTNSEVAQSAGQGIYTESTRPTTISNSSIHNNMAFGIDFYSKDVQARTTQSGNTFAANAKGDLGIGDKPATAS